VKWFLSNCFPKFYKYLSKICKEDTCQFYVASFLTGSINKSLTWLYCRFLLNIQVEAD